MPQRRFTILTMLILCKMWFTQSVHIHNEDEEKKKSDQSSNHFYFLMILSLHVEFWDWLSIDCCWTPSVYLFHIKRSRTHSQWGRRAEEEWSVFESFLFFKILSLHVEFWDWLSIVCCWTPSVYLSFSLWKATTTGRSGRGFWEWRWCMYLPPYLHAGCIYIHHSRDNKNNDDIFTKVSTTTTSPCIRLVPTEEGTFWGR